MAKLTTEEECILFEKFKLKNDLAARNLLVESYLYIAQIVAKKFIGRGVEYEDLFQVASVALVNAIERFEPDRGIKFVTFATPSMIGEIKNYFRDKTRMLHISRRDSEQLYKLHEARSRIMKDRPTPEELAEYMGVTPERVLELMELQLATSVTSLDSSVNDEEDTLLKDFIGSEEQGFEEIERKDLLLKALDRLSEEERRIVHERFWNRKSQKEIAEILGVSQMYVSRAEKKILSRLRGFCQQD